jgi:hypothetical protein
MGSAEDGREARGEVRGSENTRRGEERGGEGQKGLSLAVATEHDCRTVALTPWPLSCGVAHANPRVSELSHFR